MLRKLRVDTGSAPAATLAWVGVTLLLLYGILMLAAGANAHAKLLAATDFAALTAADSLASGKDSNSACLLAEQVAAQNSMQLQSCQVTGLDVQVEATTQFAITWGNTAGPGLTLKAKSKAGPAPR